jgi:hypothetical protein
MINGLMVNESNDSFDDYDFNINLANLIGKVEVGLTIEQIEKISEIYESNNFDENDRCPICLESFLEKENNLNIIENQQNEKIENNLIVEDRQIEEKDVKKQLRRLKCSHIFDDLCIVKWLKKHKKCPCCQTDLEEKFLK